MGLFPRKERPVALGGRSPRRGPGDGNGRGGAGRDRARLERCRRSVPASSRPRAQAFLAGVAFEPEACDPSSEAGRR